jgi:hypothetical protein
MSPIPPVRVEAVLGARDELALEEDEVEAMLEVAYLAASVDGRLGDEELEAFERAARGLLGDALTAARIDGLLNGFWKNLDRAGLVERLEQLATRLTRPPVRDQAYKLAYAMSLSDRDTNEREAAFDEQLRRATGLQADRAAELAGEVGAALEEPERGDEARGPYR